MGKLWKCETPLEYSSVLRGLTIWQDTVVYTKYLVNKLGMMPCDQAGGATTVVKEYLFPPVPSPFLSGNLDPVQVIPYGSTVIINSNASGTLCRWRPGRKTAAYIYAQGNQIVFNGHQLGVDSKKRIWAPCSIVLGWSIPGVAARIEPGLARLEFRGRTVRCQYWQLSTEFLSPTGIWVDAKDSCWFSVFNTNSTPSGYSFGRLDPASGTLTGWGIGTMVYNVHSGIAGIGEGQEVWITAHNWGVGRVYRYQSGADVIEIFSHSAIHGPAEVAMDDKDQPWFTCTGGQIATVIGGPISKEILTENKWQITPKTPEIRVTPVSVSPLGGRKMIAGSEIAPEQIAVPFRHYDTQLWSSSHPQSPVIHGKEIWFADTSEKQIGVLVA